jgi:hypothetical protein
MELEATETLQPTPKHNTTQPTHLRLALGHQARVGKDTFASQVPNVEIVSFARDLYTLTGMVQTFAQVDVSKDPTLLQKLGMLMREHYNSDFWVNRAVEQIKHIEKINPSANIVVTDMRLKNEMRAMERLGFITIKITRDNRPIDRDPSHISEIDLANEPFHHHLTNNGTEEEFKQKVKDCLSIIQSVY